MNDFTIQRENDGWSLWTVKPHTGDKADCLDRFTTKRGALAEIARRRKSASQQLS